MASLEELQNRSTISAMGEKKTIEIQKREKPYMLLTIKIKLHDNDGT